MIHYQLRCGGGHEFDGWFKDSAGFEKQAGRRLITCPICGSAEVTRALMAPGIKRKGRSSEVAPQPAPAPPPAPVEGGIAGGVIPDAVRAALQTLRAEVEKHCDYVGPEFANEARRIHNGEAPARGIYGESTAEETESLAEDGIDIARIPWLPRSES
ncbi:MAG: hypothetical protein B7X08_04220 [Acidocella sp. 20-63-7]|nr:MAG: hypothetical protein B7X08_04220 [Acidocella sp. 20-63-7]HQT45714.1 DUF1178 family protein [Acidocella sp.]